MKYIHPKTYQISNKTDSTVDFFQPRLRYIVEHYCLKCELFCGRDHDFAECKIFNKRFGVNKCPCIIMFFLNTEDIVCKNMLHCEVDE